MERQIAKFQSSRTSPDNGAGRLTAAEIRLKSSDFDASDGEGLRRRARWMTVATAALLAASLNSCTATEREPTVAADSVSIEADGLVADNFIRDEDPDGLTLGEIGALYVIDEPEDEQEPTKQEPAEKPEEKPKEEPTKKPKEKEAKKEISTAEAIDIFTKSDHKYARCGHIIKAFMADGYSYEQSVGAAANSAHESIGCNPEQHQLNGGPAKGIFQWEIRFGGVESLARDRGVSPYTMDVQIDFALKELNSTEGRAKGLFKDTKTVEDATRVFCEAFERPGVPHMSKRHKAADEIESELNKIKKG